MTAFNREENKLTKFGLEWLQALRSGTFKQAKVTLAEHDSYRKIVAFCPIGLLLELFVRHEYEGDSVQDYVRHVLFSSSHSDEEKDSGRMLAYSVIRTTVGVAVGLTNKGQDHIIELNDKQGLSFNEIADLIEADPKQFFLR